MNISIIGFPFAGKTTFGKWLAKVSDCEFLDLDKVIEGAVGNIDRFIVENGEQAFRRLEAETLKQILASGADNLVIATGGGAPTWPSTAQMLVRSTKVIWLDVPFETILEHAGEEIVHRAVFKDCASLADIRQIYDSRKDIYASIAQIRFNPQEKSE